MSAPAFPTGPIVTHRCDQYHLCQNLGRNAVGLPYVAWHSVQVVPVSSISAPAYLQPDPSAVGMSYVNTYVV